MNKQQLAAKIWSSANKMRSKIEANEYKDYILGFIFYMFLSNQEVELLRKEGVPDEDMKEELDDSNKEAKDYYKNRLGYFIPYQHLFLTWLEMGNNFTVDNVVTALSSFSHNISETHKNVFNNIFHTLETGLSKLGESQAAQTKAIRDLIKLIKDIPTDGKQDYDVLGFIYEYLISNFAANAGKKAGEFYTPHEVSVVMSEIIAHHLRGRKEIEIYDPTSGSGSLLINIGKSVARHLEDKDKIKYYAQELKENTYNLTRMNLVMKGISPSNIVVRNGDTLADDWPLFQDGADGKPIDSTYQLLRVDAVVANPPYSQNWDPANSELDPRFKDFGLAPSSKADYAFLLHNLYHIKPDGIMTIVLPHGVLFRGGEEGKIRQNLIEKNHIDTIIGLPANIFFGTGIPTIIMVLKKNRPDTDILFIDASKGFEKVGKNNKLRACDIKKIADTVVNRESGDGVYSRLVSLDEIRKNEYNLNIPRYVDSSEKPDAFDIKALMFGGIPNGEIDELKDFWDEFPSLRTELFDATSPSYSVLKHSDSLREEILRNRDIQAFRHLFNERFSDFPEVCSKRLIEQLDAVNVTREETELGNDITSRLDFTSLIDPYQAYELLDGAWNVISGDLEIIQTEGPEAMRLVDPNMVLKKKKNEEIEVQEGWKGHIFPFDLVQKAYLRDEFRRLEEMKADLANSESAKDEIEESFDEDDKQSPIYDDEKESFVPKAIEDKAKELAKPYRKNLTLAAKAYDEESFEGKTIRYALELEAGKQLKKDVKELTETLEKETKKKIECLTDEECVFLLKEKWIVPLMDALKRLPISLLDGFVKKLEALAKKYDDTLPALDRDITQTSKELASMIDDLTGGEDDMAGLMEFKRSLLGGLE